ncbi:MAG: homocysteine S-methyltransferase family protein [Bacteroidota bacterium]
MKNRSHSIYLTDGGLETDLIFNHGIELQEFAAFPLLESPNSLSVVMDYYRDYLELAKKNDLNFILESPTWRANPDWGKKLGYELEKLTYFNTLAIEKMQVLKEEYSNHISDIKISGQIGPRGDGYIAVNTMTPPEAAAYHELQVRSFKEANVDRVTAITMTYSAEALGIVTVAQQYGLPVVISFTVETDGRLPSGENLEEVILKLDSITNYYPSYYMLNCAHPTHFMHLFDNESNWKNRIQGLRVNASTKSHAELDESIELDIGDKNELGAWHGVLQSKLPFLSVFGGCCGTDITHLKAICKNILF